MQVATLTERVPVLKVLGTQRNFTLLWTGQFISLVGDGVFRVAMPWAVLQLTGSVLAMGTVFIASLAPSLLFMLFGGVAADRLPRRMILLWSDGGRAVVVAVIATLALLHVLQFWHLLALSLLFGLADSFFQPAYMAVVPQLVNERDLLQPANSLIQFGNLVSRVIGPPLGALFVASWTGEAGAFGLDAFSFLFSAGCLLLLRFPPTAAPSPETPGEDAGARSGIFADIREGVRFVARVPWLWITIAIAAASNITYSVPFVSVLPKLVSLHFGAGPWLFGLLVAADGLGSLIATIALSFLRLRRRGLVAYGTLVLSCLGLTVLGIPLPHVYAPVVAVAACVAAGFGIGCFMLIEVTLLQERVPEQLLGRVSSLDMFGSYLLLPIGLGVVGWLADRVGPSPIFIFGGLLSLALALLGLSVRDIRGLA